MHFVRGQRHFVRGGGTRLLVICDGCEIFIMGLNKSGWSRLYMAKCVWIFKLEHFVFFYVGEILSPYTYTDERVGCFFFLCVCVYQHGFCFVLLKNGMKCMCTLRVYVCQHQNSNQRVFK